MGSEMCIRDSGQSTRKNKSNNLEPHFPTSATKSRFLEDTKTAVALSHCSESTRDSIAGSWGFRLDVTPELWRNYGTSYVKKTEVEVLLVVDLSGNRLFRCFCVGDATQVYLCYLRPPFQLASPASPTSRRGTLYVCIYGSMHGN